MILHIVPDEKFIDMAYNMFEKARPNNNEFMVVGNRSSFKHIKTTPITRISRLRFLFKSFANSFAKYEFVVIHSLGNYSKIMILNADKKIKFLWLGWGFDYYCYLDQKLFFEKTLCLKEKLLKIKHKKVLQRIKSFLKYINFLKGIHLSSKAFQRINFFAPVLFEDYLLLKQQYVDFQPIYLDWNYGTLEDDFIKTNLNISGKNILLGNSSTYENNHIEAIDLISQLNLSDRKVICPLSYGSEEYAKEIINYAEKKLGDKFEPLINFMKIEEYNQTISTCSIVVMNHLRQQAVGNIVIMMFFGAKVFLDNKNPVYKFFKNNGAIIFGMDELTDENINVELTKDEQHTNKKILKKYWTRDVMLEKTKIIIETIVNA